MFQHNCQVTEINCCYGCSCCASDVTKSPLGFIEEELKETSRVYPQMMDSDVLLWLLAKFGGCYICMLMEFDEEHMLKTR